MPIETLETSPTEIIEFNKKRKLLTVTNNDPAAIIYLSDIADPSTTDAKWILYPYETIIFDGQGDKPERALYGVSDTASTSIVVGFQNEEK